MLRYRLRLLLLSLAAVVLIVASTFFANWFVVHIGAHEAAIDLRRLRVCAPQCVSHKLGAGMYPTFAALAFWLALPLFVVVTTQVGVKLVSGYAYRGLAQLGTALGAIVFFAAVVAGFIAIPDVASLAGFEQFNLDRQWGPLLLLGGSLAAVLAVRSAASVPETERAAAAPQRSDTRDRSRLPVTPLSVKQLPMPNNAPVDAGRAQSPSQQPQPSVAHTTSLVDVRPPQSAMDARSKSPSQSDVRSKSPSQSQTVLRAKSPSQSDVRTKSPSQSQTVLRSKSPSQSETVLRSKSPSQSDTVLRPKSASQSPAVARTTSPSLSPMDGRAKSASQSPAIARTTSPSLSPMDGRASQSPAVARTTSPSQLPAVATSPTIDVDLLARARTSSSGPIDLAARLEVAMRPPLPEPTPVPADQIPVAPESGLVIRKRTPTAAPSSEAPLPPDISVTIRTAPPPVAQAMMPSLASALGVASPPKSLLAGHVRYAVVSAVFSGAGITATREDGVSKLISWNDIVGIVARRLPQHAPYDGLPFVDIVSTAGSTMRILPATELVGHPLDGDVTERARGLVNLLAAQALDAKLDSATKVFATGTSKAAQLRDEKTLATHDARLA